MKDPTIDITFNFEDEVVSIRKNPDGTYFGWAQGIDYPNRTLSASDIQHWFYMLTKNW